MIGLSNISWWGVALMALLLATSLAVYLLTDRRTFRRSLKVMGRTVTQLVLLSVYVWGLYWADSLWLDLLWLLLVASLVAVMLVVRMCLPLVKMAPAVGASVLAGVGVAGGCLLFCLSESSLPLARLLVPVVAVLAGQLYASLGGGLQAYVGSLRHTRQHYQYLLACGATHFEAVMPSVRRALRAVALCQLRSMFPQFPVLPSLFYCALLFCGASPLAAAVVTLLFLLASFSASVVAMVILLFLSDRILFDKQQQFVLW